jgi:hypothetical protein
MIRKQQAEVRRLLRIVAGVAPSAHGQIYFRQFLEAKFVDANPPPREGDLATLIEWHRPLFEAEARARTTSEGSPSS